MKRLFLAIMLLSILVIAMDPGGISAAVDTTRIKLGDNVHVYKDWFEANLTDLNKPRHVVLQVDDSLLIKYKLMAGFRFSGEGFQEANDTNKLFFASPYYSDQFTNTGQDADTSRFKPIYVDLVKDSAEWNAYDNKFGFSDKAESGRTFVYDVPPYASRFCIFPIITDTVVTGSYIRLNAYRHRWDGY